MESIYQIDVRTNNTKTPVVSFQFDAGKMHINACYNAGIGKGCLRLIRIKCSYFKPVGDDNWQEFITYHVDGTPEETEVRIKFKSGVSGIHMVTPFPVRLKN